MSLETDLATPRAGVPSAPDVRALAAAEGLLDLSVARAHLPVGDVILAATGVGLAAVSYLTLEDEDTVLARLADEFGPRIFFDEEPTARARRQLEEYFAGQRTSFDVPVDLSTLTDFQRDVLDACAAIDFGRVSTYADLAHEIGRPKANRAVGNALGSNPVPIVIPCHRVLRTGGNLGGYAGGVQVKARLLEHEGVVTA